jgi:hypothetical protein
MLVGALAAQAQPPVSLYNTFVFHNNGTSLGIQSCTLHDSYTGYNISVTFPAPYLAPGGSYAKVTWGSSWPVYQGDTISFLHGANNCAWLDGTAVSSVAIGGGPSYTLGATSVGSPVTVDVYMWGGDGGGSGPPVSTNSLFCVTINNDSGTAKTYGIANVDTGLPLGIDACGDNEVYVPAGGSAQICTTAAPTNHLALVTVTGSHVGQNLPGPGGLYCNPQYDYNPNMQGDLAPANLVGTPIPPGAGPGSVSNTNVTASPFDGTGGIFYTNALGTNGPIAFNGTPSGLASNATLIVGFDAVFAELVNVANSVGRLDMDNNNGLAAIKGVEGSILSGQGSENALLSNADGDLANVYGSILSANLRLNDMDSELSGMSNNAAATGSNTVQGLGGISNLLWLADGTLSGMSNGLGLIVTNTGNLAGQMGVVSNFAEASLAATNDAVGGLSRVWSDGVNVAGLTNHLAGFAASEFANLNEQGSLAQAGANDVGTGPIASLDGSFWNMNCVVGDKTYSFDFNPMDNSGIAEIAGVSRTCEQWIACVVFILLVMKLFEKYSAGLAGTTQLQANRMSVLGNSVGQLSGAVYLPLMVALAGAIPLFIGVVVTSGVGSTWFGACGVIPFRPDGLTAALQQAYWLADQFLPINFLICSVLWYVFIRLTAGPIWAMSMLVLKSLIS